MAALTYTRQRDGEHNGKPVYEYTAVSEDRTYHVVWAYDHGGMFGYTAIRKDAQGQTEYLTARNGIHWARTLKSCKKCIDLIEEDYR